MSIKTSNRNLALEFFMWCFCKKINPFSKSFSDDFSRFCFEHYHDVPTSKRIAAVEVIYNGSMHHDLGLEIQSLNSSLAKIGDQYPIVYEKG